MVNNIKKSIHSIVKPVYSLKKRSIFFSFLCLQTVNTRLSYFRCGSSWWAAKSDVNWMVWVGGAYYTSVSQVFFLELIFDSFTTEDNENGMHEEKDRNEQYEKILKRWCFYSQTSKNSSCCLKRWRKNDSRSNNETSFISVDPFFFECVSDPILYNEVLRVTHGSRCERAIEKERNPLPKHQSEKNPNQSYISRLAVGPLFSRSTGKQRQYNRRNCVE